MVSPCPQLRRSTALANSPPSLPVKRSKEGRDMDMSRPVTLLPAGSLPSALPKALFPVTVWHIYFSSQIQTTATYHGEQETDSHW